MGVWSKDSVVWCVAARHEVELRVSTLKLGIFLYTTNSFGSLICLVKWHTKSAYISTDTGDSF